MGQVKEAEYAEPVINGNENYIGIFFDEIAAFLARFNSPANFKSSAVYPYYNRLFLRVRVFCLPNVKIQAVFTLNVKRGNLPYVLNLTRAFRIVIRLVNTVIRYNINRGFPAKFTDWLFAYKRNALVRNDTFILFADKSTVNALDR